MVADEVEEPARETAHRVSEQLADTRSSSRSLPAGTGETGRVVGELDAVRTDTAAVLSEQEQPAGEHGR